MLHNHPDPRQPEYVLQLLMRAVELAAAPGNDPDDTKHLKDVRATLRSYDIPGKPLFSLALMQDTGFVALLHSIVPILSDAELQSCADWYGDTADDLTVYGSQKTAVRHALIQYNCQHELGARHWPRPQEGFDANGSPV